MREFKRRLGDTVPILTPLPLFPPGAELQGVGCSGRPAWSPTDDRHVALLCKTDGGKAVYTATADDVGQVDPGTMTLVRALNDSSMTNVSFVGSGGIVISLESGEQVGIHNLESRDAPKAVPLTRGPDSDTMGSPVDERVVFHRNGDLFLVEAGSCPSAVTCAGRESEEDPVTGYARLPRRRAAEGVTPGTRTRHGPRAATESSSAAPLAMLRRPGSSSWTWATPAVPGWSQPKVT